MSVTELMLSICIVGILASVATPFYISYVQQARVVSIIIPRLHLIETRISLYYSTYNRLPGNSERSHILEEIDTENCEVALASGTVTMTINAPESSSKLHILNNKVLVASPVVTKHKITTWHLSGELADRLGINY
jgi:type IV pilus assembly protein PilA